MTSPQMPLRRWLVALVIAAAAPPVLWVVWQLARQIDPARELLLGAICMAAWLAVMAVVADRVGRRLYATLRCTVEDIDRENVEALRRAEQARIDAESSNRAKDDLLGLLGHELRNPLNAISTAAEVLSHVEASTPVAVNARAIIANQIRVLARTLDTLLDVGRLNASDVKLMRQPIDLAPVVQRAVDAATPEARAKGLTLVLDSPPGKCALTVWVHGDLPRLQQVAEQLIATAVKSAAGDSRIEVQLSEDGGSALLHVRATSDGIDPPQPRKSGLGMTLVRRLVELHGGSIAVSDTAASSESSVRLPRIDPPDAADEAEMADVRKRS